MVKAALHVPFLVGLASVALFLGHVKAWASDEADQAHASLQRGSGNPGPHSRQ
jgi:hypothetical protein